MTKKDNYWFIVYLGYDGNRRKAFFKLYNPSTGAIRRWHDNTGHVPYCLTDASPIDLGRVDQLVNNPGFAGFEIVEKYDAVKDENVALTKVVAKTPDAVGGKGKSVFKNVIRGKTGANVWEAAIRYIQCYLYDNPFEMGMPYTVEEGERLVPAVDEEAEKRVEKLLALFEGEEVLPYVRYWARFLEYPKIDFLRLTLDIEVLSPSPQHIPDPNRALYPVTAVGMKSTDGLKLMYLLKRSGIEDSGGFPPGVEVRMFDSERELLLTVFSHISVYPFVATFNGDEFDFKYLYFRALGLSIPKHQIPILIRRRKTTLKTGVHIDLGKLFANRSLQTYAFRKKYLNFGLDDVARGLIGRGKLKGTSDFNEASYGELASYCWTDVELTEELTTFDDELVMKLITVLSRVSQLPIEDVSRLSISGWIGNFMYNAHRKAGYLIPNREDLEKRGKVQTKPVIKGKKFRGAIVIDPVPGVHFGVSVVDFASLYPSVVKVRNLGYSTVNCKHEECKANLVPDTTNWVCTKKRALTSLLIGSLRDVRVKWYKPQSKNKSLPSEIRNWYVSAQEGIKVILNASYGVFGNDGFKLYCPPVSEAVTAWGREAIVKTIERARSIGVEILYGDTDSIFLKKPTKEQIAMLTGWALSNLGIELEVDKEYRYCILSSRKKNYLGVYPSGDVDVKGMTGKKRHTPPMIRDAFDEARRILSGVESKSDFAHAKRSISKLVKKVYLTLKKREWKSVEELSFNMALGKQIYAYTKTTPQHVKAAKILEQRGRKVEKGDVISFVKTRTKEGVKPVEFASDGDIDVDKYTDFLRSTFEQVLEPMDISFGSIMGITSIEQYM